MGYFKDVTPESVGISSKGIMKFLDRMEQNQIELHSFMVIRHGQCAAKGWWKPYDEKFRHPLYSFSKSLTATAIGFAQQEGILSVDEKIVDIFPELLPEYPSEYLKKITLHHLLIMRFRTIPKTGSLHFCIIRYSMSREHFINIIQQEPTCWLRFCGERQGRM